MKQINLSKIYSTMFKTIGFGFIALILTGHLYAQCPPYINAGSDVTILCGGDIEIGEAPTPPTTTVAPACSNAGQLTQGGGSYLNNVSTTGGINGNNISNLGTLIGGISPMGPNAWQSVWYSNYTSLVVESNAGSTFNLTIQGVSQAGNLPTYYRVWIDWDNDGTFNNSNELVWTSTTPGHNHTLTVNVPANQVSGLFRMRIRSKQNCPFIASDEACTYNNPVGSNCAAAGYGAGQSGHYWFADEIEDYTVKINGVGGAGAGAGTTYAWTPPTGLSATDVPNPTASPSTTTTYTLTVTDPINNCSATEQVTVTVAGVIDVSYTVGTCLNDLYNITGTITTTAAPATGSLVVEDCNGTLITLATAPFTGTSFPLNLTGLTADGNNCSLEIYFTAANCPETVNFTAPAPCTGCLIPFVHASNSVNENCENDDASITLSITSGGEAPFSYSIDNGTTTQASGSFTGLSAGVYNVVITDDQGCVETEQITITTTLPANATFDFADFCVGTLNGPSNIATAGGTFSFNPVPTDGATLNATTGEISNEVAGASYTVSYGLTGVCPSSSTQAVNISTATDFTLTSTAPACGGNDGSITLSGLTASTVYTISYTQDGATVGPLTITSNATGQVVISNLTHGNYTSIEAAGPNGCIASNLTTQSLVENGAPTVSAPNDIQICLGDDVTLTAINPDNAAITWNNGITDGTGFTPNAAGMYTYTVTATANNCSATDQVTVTVNSLPNINAGLDQVICEGGSITLTASGGLNHLWDHEITNGVPFSPNATATYTVIGNSPQGCINTDQVVVIVGANPDPNFVSDKLKGCDPLKVNFSSNLNLNGASCLWSFGDGTTSTDCNNVSHTYTSSGDYDVTLTITSEHGCVGTTTEEDYIEINSSPSASFTANPLNPTTTNPVVNFTNNSVNSTSFKWIFGDNSAPSSETNPSHTYPEDEEGNYVVTLIAYSGTECSDTMKTIIQVEEELVFYVPNAFTPDGDQYNPVFKPVFASGYDPNNYELLIFDRWGELLFESHDTTIGWDGTYLGVMVPDETYIWKIEIKETKSDKKHGFQGHVTILR